MEVTVLEAQNTPKKPVIAVKAGTSLRHADMVLNEPFRVPAQGLQDRRIKVSLYEQLGTQTIPDADEAESVCNVPIRTPSGSCSQVKLRIRRGQQSVTGPNFKSSTKGVEDYLVTHQLEARIQNLFETVLKTQPADPYRCMIQELQKLKQIGEPSSNGALPQPDAPKEPVAPSQPPPKYTRPAPGSKGRGQQPSEDDTEAALDDKDFKAALAEVMKQDKSKESTSLSTARQAQRSQGTKALSNLELAHEVMRLVIRQIVANMSKQSSSLGLTRQDARARAIEHSKNRAISNVVIGMVVKSAYTRIQAESLGLMGGGQCRSDTRNSKTDWVVCAETKALAQCVVKASLRKAATA